MDRKPSFASTTNWADDVEAEEAELGQVSAPLPADELLPDRPSYAMSPRSGGGGGGGGGGHHSYPSRAGPGTTPLPDQPPFKAYIGNIPYDIDEQVVEHFFRGLKISDVMVTRHRDTGNAKGCFVEFETQQDLANALTMNGRDLLRRSVSIQVAEPKHGGGGGGGGAPRGGRDSFFGDRRGGGGGGGGYNRFDEDRGPAGRWNQVRDVPLVEPANSPRERPKLILQPRKAAEGSEDAGDAAAGGAGAAKPNPFGAARPANTAAKLQELEEREKQRKSEAAAARAAAKAAVEGTGAAAGGGGGGGSIAAGSETSADDQKQIREKQEQQPHRPPPGLSAAPPGGGRGRGRVERRERDTRDTRNGDRDRRGSGRSGGGGSSRGHGEGSGELPHHRQGDSGRRGGRGGRGGSGRGDKLGSAAPAPPPPRIVTAPGEDAVPKTKVSNPFDLLGDE